MFEHHGTHVDAPRHYKQGTRWIDEIPLDTWMGPCHMIDKSSKGENQAVTREEIEEWERRYGKIGRGDIVLFNFGWHRKWSRSMPMSVDYPPLYLRDFPGVSEDGATYLLTKGVKIVGSDTTSLDPYPLLVSKEEPAHVQLLSNNVIIMENVANLDMLPPRGAFLVAFPIRIKEGSGSPVRPIAFVPLK